MTLLDATTSDSLGVMESLAGPACMPSAWMAFMSAVFARSTLWPMMFLASWPVCLRLMVNVLQLLLMSMFATSYFIASLPSMSTEQVAANAEGASASSAAVTRNLRIMGRTSRGGSVGSRPRLAKDNADYPLVQTC